MPLKQPQGRGFKIGIVYFAPDPGADSCMQGIFDRLRDLGLEEGKNLEICKTHAQGEIINIPALLQNYDGQELDLIITMSTPCLTAACSVVKKKPVVFTFVYDPIAAGAGKTGADHLPHVTGVGSFPPVRDTVDLIQRLVPGVRTVGTLYNSSEANSRKVVAVARDIFQQRGIKLEEIAITGTNEVFQAAQALAHRNIQAFWITGDNTAMQAFDGIAKVANDGKLPIINNAPEFVERGALACAGLGFQNTCPSRRLQSRRRLSILPLPGNWALSFPLNLFMNAMFLWIWLHGMAGPPELPLLKRTMMQAVAGYFRVFWQVSEMRDF
ncbi:MAG: ABC transporter substrate-binding protein [Planctomycetes bacterium]|nr:ABC transporter substrate-binding protein [Planctomycetota bacterium]